MQDLDPEIERAVTDAVSVFRRAGAKVKDVQISALDDAPDAAGLITLAEAIAFYHPYIESNPQGIGPKVLERLKRAYQLNARDLVLAHRRRLEVIATLEKVYEMFDILVGATIPAFPERSALERSRSAAARPRF